MSGVKERLTPWKRLLGGLEKLEKHPEPNEKYAD